MNDLGILITPLQPFDDGHYHALERMAQTCKSLLVVIGGSNRPQTIHAPFPIKLRLEMIDAISTVSGRELAGVALADDPDDDAWGLSLIQAVGHRLGEIGLDLRTASVGIGCFEGRGHLGRIRAIPSDWTWLDLGPTPIEINSGFLRRDYLKGGTYYGRNCPPEVATIMDWWFKSPGFRRLANDQNVIDELVRKFGDGPFEAADAVVVHRGHYLTIERGDAPNRGAIAFPGGLRDPGENALETALRELDEEVEFEGLHLDGGIAGLVPQAELRLENPKRDPRAIWKSTAFLFVLPDDIPQPKVHGRSDARRARWRAVAELIPEKMWADHGFILGPLLKRADPKRKTDAA